MARRVKDPTAEMADLHDRRVKLAMRRAEAEAAMSAAQIVLDGITERRQVAIGAEIDEAGGETVGQVDQARRAAEATIADCRERAEVFRKKEAEIGEAQDAVIDAHGEYYAQVAVALSEATSEAITAALSATQAAVSSWMETRAAWSRVRQSRRRRGLELGPEVPIDDLGTSVNELSKAQSRPWPGASRAAYERFRARPEGGEGVSNREAISAFGGD